MFIIANIGKCVGLKGELKLHLQTDFPEQFKKGATFKSDGLEVTVQYYKHDRGVVKFEGYDDRTMAEKLTTRKLYTDEEFTRANCDLDDGEFYYFDIIGSTIVEDDRVLGEVVDITDIAGTDYFSIKTDTTLVEEKYPKSFMIPYIDRYILDTDITTKTIKTKDAIAILENS
jgi:16S rRNA processing protein RimM